MFTLSTLILIKTDRKLSQSLNFSAEEDNRPLKEKIYDTLPRSITSDKVLLRTRDEDPEIQKERQELTRAKSPVELSQISSLAEFPVPKNIEKLINKKQQNLSEIDNSRPTPPPRRFRREEMYESLPASLKTEVLCTSKIETDFDTLTKRRELTRAKSPAELSEIRGIEDFPIPTFVENLTKKKLENEEIQAENLE